MCTSVIAGKHATEDGTVIVARNEEFEQNNWNKYIIGRRSPQYVLESDSNCCVGTQWRLGNGLCVPIPQTAYQYCSIADALGQTEAVYNIGEHYFFEERGINEKNVAISATNSMGINDKASLADPTVNIGIEESVILTLILPQAENARQAVELLGSYVEEYGAVEANGISFADINEIWYMEIGSGHHWIAVKVPEDKYLVVANCMRIHGINLNDTDNVLHSTGIYEFVQKNQLLQNPDVESFDFASAFGYPGKSGDPEGDPYYNVDRLWLAQKILSPSVKQQVRQPEYPLFLSPDEAISVEKVAEVLRANYQGTELEGKAERPIGVVRTAESHIMILDETMPNELQGIIWQTIGTPLGCPYMPIFAEMQEMPKQYAMGASDYDEESAYWKFRSGFSIADKFGEEAVNERNKKWRQLEQQTFVEYEQLKAVIKTFYQQDKKLTLSMAEDFSLGILLRSEQMAEEMREQLLTKLAVDQKDSSI